MGCGSSKGDVIKSASGAEVGDKIQDGSDGKTNNNKNKSKNKINSSKNKEDAMNNGSGDHGHNNGKKQALQEEDSKESLHSTTSEASTILASDKYPNGTGDSNIIPNLRPLDKLPPLKPPRSARIGFLEQNGDDLSDSGHRNIPVAFEVPADNFEDGGTSLIKRHPPRRLRKMVEDQPDEPLQLTHESLEEKVQLANQRRNQVLTQRVASARQKSARVHKPLFDSGGFNPNDYGGEIETAEKDETNVPDYL